MVLEVAGSENVFTEKVQRGKVKKKKNNIFWYFWVSNAQILWIWENMSTNAKFLKFVVSVSKTQKNSQKKNFSFFSVATFLWKAFHITQLPELLDIPVDVPNIIRYLISAPTSRNRFSIILEIFKFASYVNMASPNTIISRPCWNLHSTVY